jgi:hypothetical protein
MPEFKKQHYVPAVYLKNFSVDQSDFGRKSRVWRYSHGSEKLVSVDSQCAKDYFYSKRNAATAEKMFQETEFFYGACVQKIRAGKASDQREHFGLILLMFDLHLRNAAYENRTGEEEIVAYRLRTKALKQWLTGNNQSESTDEETMGHLEKNWRVRILASDCCERFITSDNPSIFLSNQRGQFSATILPITPIHVAIAFDRRIVRVARSQVTAIDTKRLNKYQVAQALRSIYSSGNFEALERDTVQALLNQKRKSRGKTDSTRWEATMIRLPNIGAFSFLDFEPPLP